MRAVIALLGGKRATVFALLALCLAIVAGVQSLRLATERVSAAVNETRAVRAELASARHWIASLDAVRAKEHERATSVNRIGDAFEKGKLHASKQGDQLAADLRADRVRFKRLWQGCQARSAVGVSGPAADPGEPDAADGLRAASLGRVRGIVGACQVERDALLKLAEEDRR